MESTKAKNTSFLEMFKRWIRHFRARLCTMTTARRIETSTQTSLPQVVAIKSSEARAPSEPGSPHHEGLMSCLQASSSRTRSVSAELALTSDLPCRAASRYNSAHPAEGPNPGRPESAHGEASKRARSPGTLGNCKMKRRSPGTSTKETGSGLRRTAGNVGRFCGVPSSLLSCIFHGQSESEDDDLSTSQPCTGVHLVTTARRVNQQSSASDGPSCSADRLLALILESTAPVRSGRWLITSVPPDRLTSDFSPAQDQRSGSSSRSSSSESDTVESYSEVLGPSLSGSSENLDMFPDLSQDGEENQPSQFLCDGMEDAACRSEDGSSDTLEVEEIMCRICRSTETSPDDKLLSPCSCSGTLRYIHFSCLKKWLQIRIESGSLLPDIQRCELCTGTLNLDPNQFNWINFYEEHLQQEDEDEEDDRVDRLRSILSALQEVQSGLHLQGRLISSVSDLLVAMERLRAQRRRSGS